jgi:hypothetical protein
MANLAQSPRPRGAGRQPGLRQGSEAGDLSSEHQGQALGGRRLDAPGRLVDGEPTDRRIHAVCRVRLRRPAWLNAAVLLLDPMRLRRVLRSSLGSHGRRSVGHPPNPRLEPLHAFSEAGVCRGRTAARGLGLGNARRRLAPPATGRRLDDDRTSSGAASGSSAARLTRLGTRWYDPFAHKPPSPLGRTAAANAVLSVGNGHERNGTAPSRPKPLLMEEADPPGRRYVSLGGNFEMRMGADQEPALR